MREVVGLPPALLVIALTDDKGRLLWVSAARLGRTSEITACRHDQLTQKLRGDGLGAIADLGLVGLDDSGLGTVPTRLESAAFPDATAGPSNRGCLHGARRSNQAAKARQVAFAFLPLKHTGQDSAAADTSWGGCFIPLVRLVSQWSSSRWACLAGGV
ncbi:hypothetical protein [Streptomyces xiangluensis]|uniref:hypothetical protein n=1 Tax=Streptomyces xiangluensis TaxID=2665720 RepID=UPI0036D94BBA